MRKQQNESTRPETTTQTKKSRPELPTPEMPWRLQGHPRKLGLYYEMNGLNPEARLAIFDMACLQVEAAHNEGKAAEIENWRSWHIDPEKGLVLFAKEGVYRKDRRARYPETQEGDIGLLLHIAAWFFHEYEHRIRPTMPRGYTATDLRTLVRRIAFPKPEEKAATFLGDIWTEFKANPIGCVVMMGLVLTGVAGIGWTIWFSAFHDPSGYAKRKRFLTRPLELAWHHRGKGSVSYVRHNGVIYISDDKGIQAFNLSSGKKLWSAWGTRPTKPLIAGKKIYYGDQKGFIRAYNMDGDLQWSRKMLRHAVHLRPSYTAGRLLVPQFNGLTAVSVKTQQKVWQYEPVSFDSLAKPILVAGNKLILAYSQHLLIINNLNLRNLDSIKIAKRESYISQEIEMAWYDTWQAYKRQQRRHLWRKHRGELHRLYSRARKRLNSTFSKRWASSSELAKLLQKKWQAHRSSFKNWSELSSAEQSQAKRQFKNSLKPKLSWQNSQKFRKEFKASLKQKRKAARRKIWRKISPKLKRILRKNKPLLRKEFNKKTPELRNRFSKAFEDKWFSIKTKIIYEIRQNPRAIEKYLSPQKIKIEGQILADACAPMFVEGKLYYCTTKGFYKMNLNGVLEDFIALGSRGGASVTYNPYHKRFYVHKKDRLLVLNLKLREVDWAGRQEFTTFAVHKDFYIYCEGYYLVQLDHSNKVIGKFESKQLDFSYGDKVEVSPDGKLLFGVDGLTNTFYVLKLRPGDLDKL